MLRLLLLVVFFYGSYGLQAQASTIVLDPADAIDMANPPANSTLKAAVEIRYKVYDDDSQSIPTRIEVLEKSCKTKMRTILSASLPSVNQYQVRGWNTAAGYSDGGTLPDGQYCLSICAELRNAATPYSVCRRRGVTLRNRANQAPRFTSTPTTVITQGDNYSYAPVASDADGDPLKYTVTQKPSFLSYDGVRLTGSNIQSVGDFAIVIEVRDDFGGLARQSYTLTVKPKDQPIPEPEKPVGVIVFVYPNDETFLSGKDNKIEWSLENFEKPTFLSLEYRKVGENNPWIRITKVEGEEVNTTKSYSWDVTDIDNGKYQLRIVLRTEDGSVFEGTSAEFEIKNEDDDDDVEVEELAITSLKPGDGDTVTERKPTISAKITGIEDQEKFLEENKVKILLNDVDITSKCSFEPKNDSEFLISCQPAEDLEIKEHSVEITISDSTEEKIVERSWQFSVIEETVPGEEDGPPADITNLLLIGGLTLLCLLLLPLLLLFIWRRRTRRVTYSRDVSYGDTFAPTPMPESTVTTTNTISGLGDPFTGGSVTENYFATKDDVAPKDDFAVDFTPAPLSPVVAPPQVIQPQTTVTTIEQESLPGATLEPLQTTEKKEKGGGILGWVKDKVGMKEPGDMDESTTTVKRTEKVTEEKKVIDEGFGDFTPAEDVVAAGSKKSLGGQPSTAEILSDEYSLEDEYSADNPVAPTAPVYTAATPVPAPNTRVTETTEVTETDFEPLAASAPIQVEQPQTVQAPEPQVQTTTTTTQTTSSPAADDLPDWLKGDDTDLAAVDDTTSTTTTTTTEETPSTSGSDDEEDGDSDPHGFGVYSIGKPE